MIKGKDIVCIARPNWEGDYLKSTVELMRQLARHNRVLYVEYEHTYKDVLSSLMGKGNAPVKRVLGIDSRLRSLSLENGAEIHVLTPPAVAPTNWVSSEKLYRQLLLPGARMLARSVRQAMRRIGMEKPIVINAFNPQFGIPLAGRLDEELLVYYCYDEIAAAEWCSKHGQPAEQDFMKMVDGVAVSSVGLLQAKAQSNAQIKLVQNGVDYDLFSRAYRDYPSSSAKKTIGYIGSIDDRLDYDLLEHCLSSMPQHEFWFVGRVTDNVGALRLEKHENATLFSPRPVAELPTLMKQMDAGLIPFVKNEFTANIYPLKINEYLAAGLPVVSTDFAPLRTFEQHISICSDQQGFLQLLQRELGTDHEHKRLKRTALAAQNSWQKRAEKLGSWILQLLNQKHVA